MFQNVLTSKPLTKQEVELKLLKKINAVADAIVNKHRLGIEKKVDYIKAIRNKNYLSIIESIDNCYFIFHYFNTKDKTLILNKIGS